MNKKERDVRSAVMLCLDGVVVAVKDPATGTPMLLVLSSDQAHSMGVALCEAAWQFDHDLVADEDDFDDFEDEVTAILS